MVEAPWLTVVGIGEDGLAGLSAAARALVAAAETLVGGERHLAMVPNHPDRRPWPAPFAYARDVLEGLRGRPVVVLASGDPMWFGIGATLTRWFTPAELIVIPHPGAFSLAAARLLWPLQDCLCLTVHGRPVEALALHFAPGRRLLVLAEDGQSAAAVARLLDKAGYGPSRLVVLGHLGGSETLREASAASWVGETADLSVIAVECRPEPRARLLAAIPGLPDDAFEHDGQITKRDIRAITLAALAPLAGELLWDVGAGSGSVAIEWMRAGGRAVAIEPKPDRVARIARNAAALGVPGLEILQGEAPGALPYSDPDAIFVGGGASEPGLLDACWSSLRPGGRLVVNAVTAEGEAALLDFHRRHSGEMTRLNIARLAPVGKFHTWHPAMPVMQYWGRKG